MPRWSEIKPLLRVRRPTFDPGRATARQCPQHRRSAHRRGTNNARAVFDYVDGGADAELTMRRNRDAFDAVELVPEYLHPVADPSLTTTLFGREIGMPLVFAPTGYADDAPSR